MREKIKIYGGQKTNGYVNIAGAKNAALPILAASLLSSDAMTISNVPPLLDISTMLALLENLGITYNIIKDSIHSNTIKLKTDSISNFTAPYEIVKKMRASILILGPLLARYGRCSVSLPGGCAIGVRPIDLHLKGLEALGASMKLQDGYVHAEAADGLIGGIFEFPIVTVTGTENIMMAATLAEGTTILKNAAQEPEVIDLANCLNKMGARICGHGTSTIVIDGVSSLHLANHSIIPDRIEAGTYAIAAGITGGKVDLIGGDFKPLLSSFIETMQNAGLIFSDIKNGLRVEATEAIRGINVATNPFPAFPTDLQAQTMSLLCFAENESVITENIWENRFMHVSELARMGADITVNGAHANIKGVKKLIGAQVMATDLRASFSLVLAALRAEGLTTIDRIYHLDRGYCCVKEKFASCGIEIDRII